MTDKTDEIPQSLEQQVNELEDKVWLTKAGQFADRFLLMHLVAELHRSKAINADGLIAFIARASRSVSGAEQAGLKNLAEDLQRVLAAASAAEETDDVVH